MCGTMQTAGDRHEASALYPAWGQWLNDLEQIVKAKHGFGWGDTGPRYKDIRQDDMFRPMCVDCGATP